jgi:hypothetical protein
LEIILITSASLSFNCTTGWHFDNTDSMNQSDWRGDKTLALLFGPATLLNDTDAIAQFRATVPDAIVMGASSVGVISGDALVDNHLVAHLIKFESTNIVQASLTVDTMGDSRAAGIWIASELRKKPHLKGIFILADGLSVNGTELLQGMTVVVPNIAISGGMAGDGTEFGQTCVLSEQAYAPKRVTAVGFYGEQLTFSRGCYSGSTGFGLLRRVTRSQGNEVFEVDGQPILDLYKKYLGEHANALPGSAAFFPLSLRRTSTDDSPLIRSVLAVNEASKSITVAGDMPEGCYTQLMRTSQLQLLDGAEISINQALEPLPPNAKSFVLTVSCFGRRVLLGERLEEEIDVLSEHLPKESAHLGFFSYGEISAFPGKQCDFHNMTLATTALFET